MSEYDCIIVGAGYAGLSAAKALKEAQKKVLLLEARDRIGGRCFTQKYDDGTYSDLGGSFLGKEQPRMYAFVKEFGVETFDATRPGKSILAYRGKNTPYKGLIPPLAPWELIDIHLLMRRFEKMAKKVNTAEPWKTAHAEGLDSLTLAQWVAQNSWTRVGRDMMSVAAELIWGARMTEISALYAFFYAKAGIDLTTLLSSASGAQDQLIKGGAQTIADKLHDFLGNDSVKIGEPVMKIDQDIKDNLVTVTSSKATYKARQVIIAIPPAQILRISFEPSLPHQRRSLLEHMPMGSYWKYLAHYETPFWQEEGLSGEVISLDGLIAAVFDTSPPGKADDKYGTGGVLMAFVVGHNARLLTTRSPTERRQAILSDLVRFYGPRAQTPNRLVEHTMMDEAFIGGCPVAAPAPGMLTSLGPWLTKPFHNVHWAGTETSAVWNGYMEGAVCSGQRAAKEVLDLEGHN